MHPISKKNLFADDSNFHMRLPNIQTLQLFANHETNKVDKWLKNENFTLNYKKRKCIMIGSNQSKTTKF